MQVWEVLPAQFPALAHLKSLDMCGFMMRELPVASAQSLRRLTSLTWRSSPIAEIPPALSLIKSLQKFEISDNHHLQLGPALVKSVLALQHLTMLDWSYIRMRGGDRAIQRFTNQLPQSCTVHFCDLTYDPHKGAR